MILKILAAHCGSFVCVWKGSPGGSDGKETHLQSRRPGSSPRIGKIPWRREWQPTPVSLPGELHGQRNLVGYSPWDHKVGHNFVCTEL